MSMSPHRKLWENNTLLSFTTQSRMSNRGNFSFSTVSNDFFDSCPSFNPRVNRDRERTASGSSSLPTQSQDEPDVASIEPFPRFPMSKLELQSLSRAIKLANKDKNIDRDASTSTSTSTSASNSNPILKELINILFVDRIQTSDFYNLKLVRMIDTVNAQISQAKGKEKEQEIEIRDRDPSNPSSSHPNPTSTDSSNRSAICGSDFQDLLERIHSGNVESEVDWLTRVALHSTFNPKGIIQLPSWTANDFSLYHQIQTQLQNLSNPTSSDGIERSSRPRTHAPNEQDLDSWALAPIPQKKKKKRRDTETSDSTNQVTGEAVEEKEEGLPREGGKAVRASERLTEAEGKKPQATQIENNAEKGSTSNSRKAPAEATVTRNTESRLSLPSSATIPSKLNSPSKESRKSRRSLPSHPNIIGSTSELPEKTSSASPLVEESPKRFTRSSAPADSNLKLPIPSHWQKRPAHPKQQPDLGKRKRSGNDDIVGAKVESRRTKRKIDEKGTDEEKKSSWWNVLPSALGWLKK